MQFPAKANQVLLFGSSGRYQVASCLVNKNDRIWVLMSPSNDKEMVTDHRVLTDGSFFRLLIWHLCPWLMSACCSLPGFRPECASDECMDHKVFIHQLDDITAGRGAELMVIVSGFSNQTLKQKSFRLKNLLVPGHVIVASLFEDG